MQEDSAIETQPTAPLRRREWMAAFSLRSPMARALFPRKLTDYDNQQGHHYYGDHRSEPHAATHPSVIAVHHLIPFRAVTAI
jgi:hypothetical protein